jgi:hypothetical protein
MYQQQVTDGCGKRYEERREKRDSSNFVDGRVRSRRVFAAPIGLMAADAR